jgi:hypothetical protein
MSQAKEYQTVATRLLTLLSQSPLAPPDTCFSGVILKEFVSEQSTDVRKLEFVITDLTMYLNIMKQFRNQIETSVVQQSRKQTKTEMIHILVDLDHAAILNIMQYSGPDQTILDQAQEKQHIWYNMVLPYFKQNPVALCYLKMISKIYHEKKIPIHTLEHVQSCLILIPYVEKFLMIAYQNGGCWESAFAAAFHQRDAIAKSVLDQIAKAKQIQKMQKNVKIQVGIAKAIQKTQLSASTDMNTILQSLPAEEQLKLQLWKEEIAKMRVAMEASVNHVMANQKQVIVNTSRERSWTTFFQDYLDHFNIVRFAGVLAGIVITAATVRGMKEGLVEQVWGLMWTWVETNKIGLWADLTLNKVVSPIAGLVRYLF